MTSLRDCYKDSDYSCCYWRLKATFEYTANHNGTAILNTPELIKIFCESEYYGSFPIDKWNECKIIIQLFEAYLFGIEINILMVADG